MLVGSSGLRKDSKVSSSRGRAAMEVFSLLFYHSMNISSGMVKCECVFKELEDFS